MQNINNISHCTVILTFKKYYKNLRKSIVELKNLFFISLFLSLFESFYVPIPALFCLFLVPVLGALVIKNYLKFLLGPDKEGAKH